MCSAPSRSESDHNLPCTPIPDANSASLHRHVARSLMILERMQTNAALKLAWSQIFAARENSSSLLERLGDSFSPSSFRFLPDVINSPDRKPEASPFDLQTFHTKTFEHCANKTGTSHQIRTDWTPYVLLMKTKM